jgi:hypothetical protein
MSASLPDVLGLFGMILLAWPAVAADRLAYRFARLEKTAQHPETDKAIKDIRDELLKAPRSSWNPLHRVCLFAGYGGLLAAYIIRLLS